MIVLRFVSVATRKNTPPRTLPALLTHALVAFTRDYEGSPDVPRLVVFSNMLRVIDDNGVDIKALPGLARISQRAVRVALRDLERDGWLTVKPVKKTKGLKIARLTAAGQRARDAGHAQIGSIEQDWPARYGKKRIGDLRAWLQALVRQIDVELPHYPTGYGQGDSSFTGGNYVAADPGPPRIPGHGEEWPIVLRNDPDAVSTLPLPALLSQALVAFTIDYDSDTESVFGGLGGAVTFFRFVGDAGMPLGEASQIGDVIGTGRSNLERHRLVDVEPGKPHGAGRLVTLTSRGKRVRDGYPGRVAEIEQNWRANHGAKIIDGLRKTLEALDDRLENDLPDFPDTNTWLRRPRANKR